MITSFASPGIRIDDVGAAFVRHAQASVRVEYTAADSSSVKRIID